MAERLGTIFVELDIDYTKFTKSQRTVIDEARGTALNIEKDFRVLGEKSDVMFSAMQQRAVNAYAAITNASGISASAQIRAEMAKNRAIQDAQAVHWNALGIRSLAAINAERDMMMKNYELLKSQAIGNASEIARIEKAKTAQLKQLHNEVAMSHEDSMAAMTRAVLRVYAAWYVLSSVVDVFVNQIKGGIDAIDSMKVSIATIAAQVAQVSTKPSIAEAYKEGKAYAEALLPVLYQIDAKSLANFQNLMDMVRAMGNYHAFLDSTNKKQIEAFTTLSNLITVMNQGPHLAQQYFQEMNAIMSGTTRQTDRVALQLDTIIKSTTKYKGGLKEIRDLSKDNSEYIVNLLPYVVGMNEATKDIADSWMAVKSSIETAWNILQREVFKDIYADVVRIGNAFATYLKANAKDVAKEVTGVYYAIKWGVEATTAIVGAFVALKVAAVVWEWLKFKVEDVYTATKKWNALVGTESVAAASKLKLAIGVFAAWEVGFGIGTWLNKFAAIRVAGVNMVYGLISAYKTLEITARSINLNPFSDPVEEAKRIDKLNKAYVNWYAKFKKDWEQAKKDARDEDNNPPPKPSSAAQVAGGKGSEDEAAKEKRLQAAHESQARVIRILTQTYKDLYDARVLAANEAAKAAQDRGQDELRTVQNLHDSLVKARTDLRDKQLALARQTAESDAKTAKEGYDVDKVYNEKKLEIQSQYKRDIMGMDNNLLNSKRDISKEQISVAAKLYDTIDEFSQEAITANKKALDVEYRDYSRYNKDVVNAAKKAATDKLEAERGLGKAQKEETYTIATKGEYSDAALKAIEKRLKKEALLEKAKYGESFDMEAWLTNKMAEELLKRATDKANFYAEIGGMGDAWLAAELGRIQKWEEAEIKAGRSPVAVHKKASQDTIAANTKVYKTQKEDIDMMLGATKDMVSQSIGLFGEQSKARSALHTLEMACKAAEIAMQIRENILLAVGSIAKQGTGGDVYSSPARIAAMIGIMSGVLALAGLTFGGGSGGGGGGGGFVNTTKKVGLDPEKSESISKSFDLMKDTYDMQYERLTAVYTELRNLNNSVDKVITNVLRIGNIQSFPSFSFFDDLIKQSSGIYVGNKGAGTYTKTEIGNEKWYDYERNKSLTNLFYGPNGVFTNMKKTMLGVIEELGGSSKKVMDFAVGFTRIKLSGLSSDEINEKISSYISGVSDKMAKKILGTWILTYQKLDEGLMETAVRLARDKVVVEEILEMTNITIHKSAQEMVAVSEALITIAGDLETLQDISASYFDKFFTDAEKQARLQSELSEALAEYGYTLPTTRDGYRKLVESLDITQKYGQEAYVALLQWSDAADEFYTSMDDALDKFENISKAITEWLNNLVTSNLAPVLSMEVYRSQYTQARTTAYATGASEEDVSTYLDQASQYLEFMRSYGGDYLALYNSVVNDAKTLGAAADQRMSVQEMQLSEAQKQTAILQKIANEGFGISTTSTGMWSGGLAIRRGTAIAEKGPEWVVPTYEPERSTFLRNAPSSFYRNLEYNTTRSGSSDNGDIHVHVILNEKEIGYAMARQTERNMDLRTKIKNVRS